MDVLAGRSRDPLRPLSEFTLDSNSNLHASSSQVAILLLQVDQIVLATHHVHKTKNLEWRDRTVYTNLAVFTNGGAEY